MKYILTSIFCLLLLLNNEAVFGQSFKDGLSLTASYNAMLAGTYSNTEIDADGSGYLIGGDFGIQYRLSNSIIYTLSWGFHYNRDAYDIINIDQNNGEEFVEITEHSRYTQLSLGLQYVPTKFNKKLNPFIGISISPTYFKTYNMHSPINGEIFDNTETQNLLFADLSLGCYYKVGNRFDVSFSISGGHNLNSNWDSFVMYQAQMGVRYSFSKQ
jgi:hypothetical protein